MNVTHTHVICIMDERGKLKKYARPNYKDFIEAVQVAVVMKEEDPELILNILTIHRHTVSLEQAEEICSKIAEENC